MAAAELRRERVLAAVTGRGRGLVVSSGTFGNDEDVPGLALVDFLILNWKSRLCRLVSLIVVSHVLLVLSLVLARWVGRQCQEYRG